MYCGLACNPALHRTTPEAKKLRNKAYHLGKIYGITPEERDALEKKQEGVCAICHLPPDGRGHHGTLFVDHEHGTGRVRGLLCGRCNTAIGLFKDNIPALKNAIAYLE